VGWLAGFSGAGLGYTLTNRAVHGAVPKREGRLARLRRDSSNARDWRARLGIAAGTFLVLGALFAALAQLGFIGLLTPAQALCVPQGGPTVVTNEPDYLVGETVIADGCGFDSYIAQNLTLRITDPTAVVTNYTVTIDSTGAFTNSNYVVPNKDGSFTVNVLDGTTVLATTYFSTSRLPQSVTLDGGSAWTCTSGPSDNCGSNNGAAATVAPGASITVVFTVQTTGGSTWRCNQWDAEGFISGTDQFEPDHTTNGTYVETFTITAPNMPGTHNLILHGRSDDGCSSGSSGKITLTDAITVNAVANPTLSSSCGGSY